MPQATPTSATMSRRQLALLTASLMLAIALAALDVLIVGTAMPTIVGTLGGLSLYSWLVSAYLVTSTTTVPVFGRLADVYGRKPIFLAGIAVFLVGSILCGLSASMIQLVAFRAVQGLGAGAVMPMAMTIIGDVFSVEQRARMQALFSSVWGVSSIVGPPLGGLIVSYLSWRWVFFVNVPVGLLAMLLILVVYRERIEHHSRKVDLAGAALLTIGVTTLLFALQETGQEEVVSGSSLALLYFLALGLLGAFVWWQSRSSDPTVPFSILRRPVIGVGYLLGLLAGLAQFGVGTYLPLYVQGAMTGTAMTVGAVMAPMSIGWPIGGIASGRLILRTGYKHVLSIGMAAIAVGTAGLLLLQPSTALALPMALSAIIGLGMGLSATPTMIAVQNAVGWSQRGVATALNQFFRTMGGALGVAIMGSMLNSDLSARLSGGESPKGLLNSLLDPVGRAALSTETVGALSAALAASLHNLYLVVVAAGVVGLLVALVLFPGGSVQEHGAKNA